MDGVAVTSETKLDGLVEAFLAWYAADAHSQLEGYYDGQLTEARLRSMSDAELVAFFHEFARDGGKVQSGGARTASRLKASIEADTPAFREHVLAPFGSDLDVAVWLKAGDRFKNWGRGIATIYLCRVDRNRFVVVNNKSIEAYGRLGYPVRKRPVEASYADLEAAQRDLIQRFPAMGNFYRTDAFSHFLVGTDKGKALLGEEEATSSKDLRDGRHWAQYPRETWEFFFDICRDLISGMGIGPGDPVLDMNLRIDGGRERINVTLRQRYVLGTEESTRPGFWFTLGPEAAQRYPNARLEEFNETLFRGEPKARSYFMPMAVAREQVPVVWPEFMELNKAYAKPSDSSIYRKHHVPDLYSMAMDPEFREAALDFLLEGTGSWPGDRTNADEMTIWKLGVYWGKGKPSFYKLIKERENVISVNDQRYSPGDLILITDGFEVKAIAQVTAEMVPVTSKPELEQVFKALEIDYEDWVLIAGADWYELPPELRFEYQLQSGIRRVKQREVRDRAMRLWRERGQVRNVNTIGRTTEGMALNTILYGPPGTGKTYRTVDHALGIMRGEPLPAYGPEGRNALRERFNELRQEGRIEAVTFHQAMSYEDFIEGIKPRLEDAEDEAGELGYVLQDGLFKRIAIRAAFEYVERDSGKAGAALAFGDRFDAYVAEVTERLEAEQEIVLPTRGGKKIFVTGVSDRGNLLLKHENGDRIYTVSKARSEKLFNAYPDLKDVKNIYLDFREVIGGSNASAYWVVLEQLNQRKPDGSKETARKVEYEEMAELVGKIDWKDERVRSLRARPYVLVIDEINRGNVAGIFGELITLLEEDKRAGAREYVEAWLPYSKKPFVVPPNLYVIGTMNTADRSVEALDTALRRRFSFVECPSEPGVLAALSYRHIGPVDLVKLLKVINARVEMLLDRDHHIGHSYFLNWDRDAQGRLVEMGPAAREARLRAVFRNNIMPLLQEYFYGDPMKVGMVLGGAFVKELSRVQGGSIGFAEGFGDDVETNSRYELVDPTDTTLMPDVSGFKAICDALPADPSP